MMNSARNRHELFDLLPVHLRQVTRLRRKPSLHISRRRDRAVSNLVL